MNVLVTCPRHFEQETSNEIKTILQEIGDQTPHVEDVGISGILAVTTEIDPINFVKKIKENLIEEPWTIRYIQRAIPIQSEVKTQLEQIVHKAHELSSIMQKQDTYRITVEKRYANISTSDIISEIATGIANKVCLDNPDWIVLIQIIGARAGVSVLNDAHIVSTEKEKRAL